MACIRCNSILKTCSIFLLLIHIGSGKVFNSFIYIAIPYFSDKICCYHALKVVFNVGKFCKLFPYCFGAPPPLKKRSIE